MDVFTPGDHGSTFGGYPLAAVVGLKALNLLIEDNLVAQSAELGDYFIERLRAITSRYVSEVRGRGLFIGIEIKPGSITARELCLRLMKKGLLSKETHEMMAVAMKMA